MKPLPMRVTDEMLAFAKANPERSVTIPLTDYLELLRSVEVDDTLSWCEICGAWISMEDPARAHCVDDVSGCWKSLSDRAADQHLCRSHRAAVLDEIEVAMKQERARADARY